MARWGMKLTKGTASVQGVGYLNAAASSPRRAKVYDWKLGCSDTPADNIFNHTIQRCTTAPTASAKTPNSLDPADTLACTIVANDTVTVDGTLTANAFLDSIPLNSRASFRWVAAPYGELIIPATANNGFMLGLDAASTTKFAYGVAIEEY